MIPLAEKIAKTLNGIDNEILLLKHSTWIAGTRTEGSLGAEMLLLAPSIAGKTIVENAIAAAGQSETAKVYSLEEDVNKLEVRQIMKTGYVIKIASSTKDAYRQWNFARVSVEESSLDDTLHFNPLRYTFAHSTTPPKKEIHEADYLTATILKLAEEVEHGKVSDSTALKLVDEIIGRWDR